MSKMSMIHAELTEQCARLGFQDLGEAEQAGYGVDWQNARLIKVEDEQEKAHEAWLEERDEVIKGLERLIALEKLLSKVYGDEFGASESNIKDLQRAIDFIQKGEC